MTGGLRTIAGRLTSQRGMSLILAVFLIVVMIGMVALAVDIGRLYVARQFLVNSCDAAALAGGIELPNRTKAEVKAAETAAANRMSSFEVSFPEEGLTASGATLIRVDGALTVPHTFAQVIGFTSRAVGAHAVVKRTGPVQAVKGLLVPWGVPYYDSSGTPYDYDNGVLYTLKVGSQSELADGSVAKTGGNFYPLALDRSLGDGSSGADIYERDIKYGFHGEVEIGDMVATEPGNMVGPTRKAVITAADSRFNQAQQEPWADDTWDNYDYGNPRIVIVPIISPLGNGRTDVEILGFAAFWIESCSGQEVSGYFIDYTIPGTGGSGTDYGVFTFRLIE